VLRKLVGYAAIMFGANAVTGLLNFCVTVFGMLSRSKDTFGHYAWYMLVYGLGQGFLIYGVNASVQRYGADDEVGRLRFAKLALILFPAVALILGSAGVVMGLLWRWNVALGLIGTPWIAVWAWGRYILRARGDAAREALLMSIASLSNTIFQILFLSLSTFDDALIYGDFVALVASGSAGVYFIVRTSGVSFRELMAVKVPRQFAVDAFKFARPVWWAGQVSVVGTYAGGFVTRTQLGAAPLAALQAAQTFWQFAFKPIELISQAALPALVSAKDQREALYRDVLRLALISFPMIAIAVSAASPLILLVIDLLSPLLGLTGEPMTQKYAEVPQLLLVLALSVPAIGFGAVTQQYALAVGRGRTHIVAQGAGAITTVVLVYPCVAAFGLVGVLVCGVISQLAINLCFPILLMKEHPEPMRQGTRWLAVAFITTVVVLVPSFLFQEHRLGWLNAIPALIIYGVMMAATGLLRASDLTNLRSLLRRRKS